MQLTNYQKYQQQLLSIYDNLAKLTHLLELPSEEAKLNRGRSILQKEDFKVLVVGEFSRGKSTFLNAIANTALLPSSKIPTTEIITKLKYSDNPNVVISYKDTSLPKASTSIENFKHLRAPKQNESPEDILEKKQYLSSISEATISYPIELCRNDILLIDTPGTNDTDYDRVQVTYKYLNNADAAILVLAANQPLSKSELRFIKEKLNTNQIKDIFYVINFKDQLRPEEEDKVKEYVRTNLLDFFTNNSARSSIEVPDLSNKIFLVSSKQALVYYQHQHGEPLKEKTIAKWLPKDINYTGIPELTEALKSFLGEEKGKSKIYRNICMLRESIIYLNETLAQKHNILLCDYQVVVNRLKELEPKFTYSQNKLTNISESMYSQLKQSESKIKTFCENTISTVLSTANEYISSCIDEDDFSNSSLNNTIKQAIASEHEQLKILLSKIEQDIFVPSQQSAYNNASKILGSLKDDCKALVTSNNTAMVACSTINTDIDIDIDLSSSSAISEDLKSIVIGGGIGLAIAGAPLLPIIAIAVGIFSFFGFSSSSDFRSKARKQSRKSIEAHFSELQTSLLSSLDDSINSAKDNFFNTFSSRIDEMKNQLDIALKEHQNTKIQTDAKLAEIMDYQKTLETYLTELSTVLKEIKHG